MRRKATWLLSTALSVLLIAGCGGSKPSEPATANNNTSAPAPASNTPAPKAETPKTPIKVKVGVSGRSINYTYFWLAETNGFFKDEGLETELVVFDGGPPTVQAMIAGEIPIAVSSSYEAMASRLEGADLKVVATFVPNAPHQLIARPAIKTPADLKGKKVGVSKIGAESHKAAKEAVKMAGLDPEKDVAYVAVGGQTQRVAALLVGSIDATVVSPPGTSQLIKQGYNKLADLIAGHIETAHENIITRDKTIKENPEMIRRFMRALVRGIHYFHTNPEGSKKFIAEYLKMELPKDQDDLDGAYEDYKKSNAPEAPLPAVKGMKRQLEALAEAKKDPKILESNMAQFYDASFIQELIDNGFIKKLYETK